MTIHFKKLLRNRRGAGLTEYIILVGVIAILAITGFRFFGESVKAKVQQQADTVNALEGDEVD